MTEREYTNYADFWPYYLKEHAKPATRAWHYVGTSLAILVMAYALISGRFGLLLAVPVCGYAFAWVSHAFIERNKPATFTYPLWSLISDFRMFWCFITGRLSKELSAAGIHS